MLLLNITHVCFYNFFNQFYFAQTRIFEPDSTDSIKIEHYDKVIFENIKKTKMEATTGRVACSPE